MKITIVYDNTAFRNDLTADWGFAALVETAERTILFDTGGSGRILLSNMAKLDIDPARIKDVIISHAHFDHTGGLSAFLDHNPDVTVWVPPSFRGVKRVRKVVQVKDARRLYDGIYSTGELEGIEQSLCLDVPGGIHILAGCSHPPLDRIIAAASRFGPVQGIIGGLHSNRPEALQGLSLICATHCTQYKQVIKAMYPDCYLEGGAGRVIELAGRQ